MFAIAFDLTVSDVAKHHPKSISQAYADINRTLKKFKFEGVQGSVYLSSSDDMANMVAAILALKALPWFPKSVRDVRAFKVENWSNFTAIVKSN
jgi:virulence-associated protein VapD